MMHTGVRKGARRLQARGGATERGAAFTQDSCDLGICIAAVSHLIHLPLQVVKLLLCGQRDVASEVSRYVAMGERPLVRGPLRGADQTVVGIRVKDPEW